MRGQVATALVAFEWVHRGEPGKLPLHLVGLLTSHTPAERDGEESGAKWLSDLLAGVGEGQRNDACARLRYCAVELEEPSSPSRVLTNLF